MSKIGFSCLILLASSAAAQVRLPGDALATRQAPKIGEPSDKAPRSTNPTPTNRAPQTAYTVLALVPKGGVDRSADISAAASAAGETGAVILASGSYVLNTQPKLYGTGVAGFGAHFSGKAGLPGITDHTALLASPFFQSKLMIASGNAATGSANEHVSYVSGYINPTNAAAGYQKNVRYTTLVHADPSLYASPGNGVNAARLSIGKDGVGDDVQVSLAKGNMQGRIFARDSITQYPVGTDGAGTVEELKSVNNTSSQPWYGTSTSKHMLNLFADGSGYHTSGLWLDVAESGEGGFYDAIMLTGQSVVNNALMYRQTTSASAPVLAQITKAGQGRFADGLGVGNVTATATPLGRLIGKMPVFDMAGKPLGVVPVYAN